MVKKSRKSTGTRKAKKPTTEAVVSDIEELNDVAEPAAVKEVPLDPTKNKCHLLKLPTEIRYRIWRYAVKHDDPVVPKQIQQRSNKFAFVRYRDVKAYVSGNKYIDDNAVNLGWPTAMMLSATCHQIYDEISTEAIFYQSNQFEFMSSRTMLVYLVAIAPLRAKNIRSIVLYTGQDSDKVLADSLTLLASLQGLRKLKVVVVSGSFSYYSSPYNFKWVEILRDYMRGLERFDVVNYGNRGVSNPISASREETALKKLNKQCRDLVTQPGPSLVTRSMVDRVLQGIPLDIYGDGRLGPDRKPSFVSSRTRAQKEQTCDENGLVQRGPPPKFSKFGDLVWRMVEVKQSRKVKRGPQAGQVQLLISWSYPWEYTHDLPNSSRPADSWDYLDQVLNEWTVTWIASFYEKNPTAYDIDVVIDSVVETFSANPDVDLVQKSLPRIMKRMERIRNVRNVRNANLKAEKENNRIKNKRTVAVGGQNT